MRAYLTNDIYRAQVVDLFFVHIYLSLVPVVLALVLAIPLGWLASRNATTRFLFLSVSSIVYTIPSLALFVILPLVLGTGITSGINIIVALTVYTTALLVRGVVDAIDALPATVIASATAMGYTPLRRFLTVELPNAVPVLVAGLRVATVSNVSLVSVAVLIGSGGLGQLFLLGFQISYVPPQIVGLVLIALIALVADSLLVLAQRLATPWLRVAS